MRGGRGRAVGRRTSPTQGNSRSRFGVGRKTVPPAPTRAGTWMLRLPVICTEFCPIPRPERLSVEAKISGAPALRTSGPLPSEPPPFELPGDPRGTSPDPPTQSCSTLGAQCAARPTSVPGQGAGPTSYPWCCGRRPQPEPRRRPQSSRADRGSRRCRPARTRRARTTAGRGAPTPTWRQPAARPASRASDSLISETRAALVQTATTRRPSN